MTNKFFQYFLIFIATLSFGMFVFFTIEDSIRFNEASFLKDEDVLKDVDTVKISALESNIFNSIDAILSIAPIVDAYTIYEHNRYYLQLSVSSSNDNEVAIEDTKTLPKVHALVASIQLEDPLYFEQGKSTTILYDTIFIENSNTSVQGALLNETLGIGIRSDKLPESRNVTISSDIQLIDKDGKKVGEVLKPKVIISVVKLTTEGNWAVKLPENYRFLISKLFFLAVSVTSLLISFVIGMIGRKQMYSR